MNPGQSAVFYLSSVDGVDVNSLSRTELLLAANAWATTYLAEQQEVANYIALLNSEDADISRYRREYREVIKRTLRIGNQ
ncbi:hypothetical protein SEA_CECE_186 [Microbacterium phage Cece]|nr:hypothetical protein SEA_CECE_186 [Microbacterium phage Cece]